MAEGVLKKLVQEKNLRHQIHSAGTNRYHKGGPADPRTVSAAKSFGLDISTHVARRLTSNDFDHYDVIFTMAGEVTEEMEDFIRSEQDRSKIINFLDSIYPGQNKSVPDPWYGGEKDFLECYQLIERASRAWIDAAFKLC